MTDLAKPMSEAEALEWGKSLARDVKEVLDKYPEAGPDNVRHTLILLQLSPEERLKRGLIRGRAAALYRK